MARILVVDDDEAIRSVLRRLLENEGYEVAEAADGKSASDLHEKEPADLLIMDLFMPDVDGMETMIRLVDRFPDIKVVAMTGGGWSGKATVLEEAIGVGAVGKLEKPFSRAQVLDVVGAALAQSAGGDS